MFTEKDVKRTWKSMMDRCANGYAKVCEEWNDYSMFSQWYWINIYGSEQFRLELDKDLFSKGEKLYSPDTCCFLPKSINLILASCTSRNKLLPGILHTKSNTFMVQVNHGSIVRKQTFKTEHEAFLFYKDEKEKNIKIVAEAYKFLLPQKIYDALIGYEVNANRGEWQEGYNRNFEVYPTCNTVTRVTP